MAKSWTNVLVDESDPCPGIVCLMGVGATYKQIRTTCLFIEGSDAVVTPDYI